MSSITRENEILAKKDRFKSLQLSCEVISGVSSQVSGVEHELYTVVRMQQKSLNVSQQRERERERDRERQRKKERKKEKERNSKFLISFSQDKNNDTPQGALIELYENINEMKNRAALAEAVITVVIHDQDKTEFAKARILPST